MTFLDSVAQHPWAALGVAVWSVVIVAVIFGSIKDCCVSLLAREQTRIADRTQPGVVPLKPESIAEVFFINDRPVVAARRPSRRVS